MKTLPVLAATLIALGAPPTLLAQQAKLWSNASKTAQPSKLSYVAYAEATVPAKQMNVQVSNFDYNRN